MIFVSRTSERRPCKRRRLGPRWRTAACALVAAAAWGCGGSPSSSTDVTPTPTPTPRPNIDTLIARCPTAEEVHAIDARLRLIFDADPTRGEPLACTASAGSVDLTAYQRRVYSSLLAMQQIPFDAPLPWTPLPLWDWFVSKVRGVHFSSNTAYSWCCEPGNRIVIATAASRATDHSCLMVRDTTRWIAANAGCGMDAFVVLLAHEARHLDDKPHTCGSSDNTIAEMGAWAVQYYLYRWFAEHTGDYLTPADGLPSASFYRDEAHQEAVRTCSVRFCHDTCPPGFGFGESTLDADDRPEWRACSEP